MKGTEIRADLCAVEREVLLDAEKMEQVCRKAAERHGATVVASVKAVLGETSPPGLTLAVLLDESSIVVHTYANEGLMAIDVFTCGKKANPHRIVKDIIAYARGIVTFSDSSSRFAEIAKEYW